MKIYGHPWSINTRKTLMTLAEQGKEAELVVVVIPKGEQKQPEHLARHPFGKVPVLDDDGFMLYEARAINGYLDRKFGGSLTPSDARDAARVDQWTNVADAYFTPHAGKFVMETLFRRYLGGDADLKAIEDARREMQPALDAADAHLADNDYFAGSSFSLADIHWMPYVEYLVQTGNSSVLGDRKHLLAWWERVSGRKTWQQVARSGAQPYEAQA